MKIIAESSTTRTEWVLAEGNQILEHAFTEGLNPYFQTRRDMSHSIRLGLPDAFFKKRWDHVYFYGAGCANAEKKKLVEASLVAQFKTPSTVESDLLGAARGLLVNEPGIACILGTGSNSCLYDGESIRENVRSAGFILGDEGSGSTLGKMFVSDCIKNIAPRELMQEFFDKFNVTCDEIMDAVYSSPYANRSLSTYSFFLSEHLENDYVVDLVKRNFGDFFERNILHYDYKKYSISFVGQVACIYSNLLKNVAAKYGIEIKKITRCSMPGLIEFHSDM